MPAYIELLPQFPNRFLVETGTWHGHLIDMALRNNIFDAIYTIELGVDYYKAAVEKFKNWPGAEKVNFIHGDSGEILGDVIQPLDAPITFWLDAHGFQYFNGAPVAADAFAPTMKELAHIAEHPIKTHTILIDDVRAWQEDQFGYMTRDGVIEALRKINPDYEIYTISGYIADDIMVARPRQ